MTALLVAAAVAGFDRPSTAVPAAVAAFLVEYKPKAEALAAHLFTNVTMRTRSWAGPAPPGDPGTVTEYVAGGDSWRTTCTAATGTGSVVVRPDAVFRPTAGPGDSLRPAALDRNIDLRSWAVGPGVPDQPPSGRTHGGGLGLVVGLQTACSLFKKPAGQQRAVTEDRDHVTIDGVGFRKPHLIIDRVEELSPTGRTV